MTVSQPHLLGCGKQGQRKEAVGNTGATKGTVLQVVAIHLGWFCVLPEPLPLLGVWGGVCRPQKEPS